MSSTVDAPADKRVLDRIEGGYALMLDRARFGEFLFVGSESKGGQSRVIRLDTGEACTATSEVGGMMHILPVPGESGVYVAAMGMYAPFIGGQAAVYMLTPGEAWNSEWRVEKLFDMPFVHRLGFLEVSGRRWLLVATVSSHKDSPDDWSRPGELYAVDFDAAMESGRWDLTLVSEAIFRNHGMWAGHFDGERTLLVSGAEGLFAVRAEAEEAGLGDSSDVRSAVRQTSGRAGFRLEPIIEEEISEMVACDLDGDGVDEMVTIEPFHGHRLRVYKRGGLSAGTQRGGGASERARWQAVWETEDLSFGHGLNVIPCGSRTLILAGNRRAGGELLAFDLGDLSGEAKRYVLDRDVAPTQIEPWGGGLPGAGSLPGGGRGPDVLSEPPAGTARIISCNQGAGEVSLYYVTSR